MLEISEAPGLAAVMIAVKKLRRLGFASMGMGMGMVINAPAIPNRIDVHVHDPMHK